AVHRLRCRDHRRDADLRRPSGLAPRPRSEADRGEGWATTGHGRNHELRLTKGGTMHGRKMSAVRGKRPMLAVLTITLLAVLAAALAFVSTGSGNTGTRHAAKAPPVLVGKGGGFGEVYVAKASTLKHTLFNA